MKLLAAFKEFISNENLFQKKDKLLVAVSGGIDSVVLCALCKNAGYDFAMAHCNFKLRGEDSNRDALFTEKLAKEFGVNLFSKEFDTTTVARTEKKSIEEAARDLRYTWFEELRSKNKFDYILTAHHLDDNIETVVMNFFRGTGIKGLRGILPKQGKIIRPLLFAKRSDLEDHLFEHSLQYVSDHTNFENDYTRNYFRNTVLPMIYKQFPEVENNISKNIDRFKEAEQLYQQSINIHKKNLTEIKGNEVHIPVLKLQKISPVKTILYEIIKDYGFTAHQTDEALALLQSESGKYIQSSTHRIIRNRKWLIISPNKTTEAENILIEKKDMQVEFLSGKIGVKELSIIHYPLSTDPSIASLDAKEIVFPLLLRKWKQGDYFYPLGMQKKKKISRFLIDLKLSLSEKEKVWVIESNRKIVWIIGLRIDDRVKITPQTKTVLQLTLHSSL